MQRLLLVGLVGLLGLALLAAPALAARGGAQGSPTQPDAIYADGQLFGTNPQGALPYNGNDASYDMLFQVPGQQPVSEAGPGNPAYNGGRWLPVPVTWNTDPYVLTSYAAVQAAADSGDITLGEPSRGGTFLCPLVPQR